MPATQHKHLPPPTLEELGLKPLIPRGQRPSGELLPKPKKFRFQLLAEYIAESFDRDTRIADVGGGKGMLAYLLRQLRFDCVVLDPHEQALPDKYKDLKTGKRVQIAQDAAVPRRPEPFRIEHGEEFNLLVGLHAHGANLAMLESAARYGTDVLLLPCCVIGEPEAPPQGKSWFLWLTERAESLGLGVRYFQLNFKGQSIGFVASAGDETTCSEGVAE